MKNCWLLFMFGLLSFSSFAETATTNMLPADEMLAKYFQDETAKLSERCLVDIKSLEDWNAKKPKYREELFEMLGLSPLPEKTDLHPVITGKIEHDEFTVEKLHFQSRPHLYVTANLYLPKKAKAPCPAVLYVCGHSKMVTNGVSLGNKTAYQHHGAWFARNGYACLVIDTLQLGEIEGIHHGTYKEGMWWWNSRGYTPAGVEAWNNIRALDYLETRPEVDKNRLGVTGRSGGGAYSWVLAALDDRIKVAAPVAGITDLQNYVVDGCVEGHCDCMFVVNTYRWDYPLLAAMAAPRPLMLGNSDKDKIFPLDGIQRLHAKVKKIYELHQAADKFALLISDGPHADTQDLQLPVFRWFNRHLKGEDPIIAMAATNIFDPAQLKVFEKIPDDQINTKVQEQFVPKANASVPQTKEEWEKLRDGWMKNLREKVFAGWPEEGATFVPRPVTAAEKDGISLLVYEFTSQPNVDLRLYRVQLTADQNPKAITLHVLGEKDWPTWMAGLASGFENELKEELVRLPGDPAKNVNGFSHLKSALEKSGETLVFFAPRGVGNSAWSGNERKQIQIRRRFMLLGQTLDAMRVWDVRCAINALTSLPASHGLPLKLRGSGDAAVNCVYAALFDEVAALELSQLPASHDKAPDYLNVLRVLDIPQAVAMAAEKQTVNLSDESEGDWQFPIETARRFRGHGKFVLSPPR